MWEQKNTKKQVEHVTVFNAKEKGLWLKHNDQFTHTDDCINEHVGLAASKDKLLELCNEHQNEIMLHVMALDQKHFRC